jgi:hypothetical protein
MQQLSRQDLSAICTACHEAGQREIPFYIAGAGLPNLPGVLAEAKSYAERLFDYSRLGPLPDTDAERALIVPAAAIGVQWQPGAADRVLAASAGYPFFLQTFGRHTWDSAPGPSVISDEDAAVGVAIGVEQLDRGFFRARWDRATRYQRQYLTAMAEDGDGPSNSGDIAQRLERIASSLGPVRADLIARGLVYAPEHGQIAFTVPGMAEFIGRQTS